MSKRNLIEGGGGGGGEVSKENLVRRRWESITG